jgi:hypothetical protein
MNQNKISTYRAYLYDDDLLHSYRIQDNANRKKKSANLCEKIGSFFLNSDIASS